MVSAAGSLCLITLLSNMPVSFGLSKECCCHLHVRANGVSKFANVDVTYTHTGDHNYGCRLWFAGAAELPANNDVIDKALALFKCECAIQSVTSLHMLG